MLKIKILISLAKGSKKLMEISKEVNSSIQAVSYQLKKLKEEHLIEKEGKLYRITEKGKELLNKMCGEIAKALYKKSIVLKGKVFSGSGEGRKYLSIKDYREGIKKLLGFSPYKGTLNIKLLEESLEKKAELLRMPMKFLKGFEKNGKRYNGVFLIECYINGVKGGIVIPIKSRYGNDVVEVIAKQNLRKKLNLKDGDVVEIVV